MLFCPNFEKTRNEVWTVYRYMFVLFRTWCNNSLIFWATDSRFRMEVHMDHPDKMGIHAKKNLHGIHARKIPWAMELAITQTFLTYRLRISHGSLYKPSEKMCIHAKKNLDGNPCKKNSMDHGISYNSDIFWARDSGFRIEFCMDYPKK